MSDDVMPADAAMAAPAVAPRYPHGGALLVACLKTQGVRRLFCVPGESYLAVLDALHDREVETVVARHEGGATMMAEAHAKLTGEVGIAFVTRGPGATNGSSGVHVAFQDSTPMILFIGDVASDQRDREAFQEVDFPTMFGPLAKWAARIDSADRLPEYVSRAFHVAQSGRPGPVVLALPEDMLSGAVQDSARPVARAEPASLHPSEADITRIHALLAAANRPFLLVGGGAWSARAREALGAYAQAMAIPVGVSFRCQDYLDNRHPAYVGDVGIAPNPKLAETLRNADVICVLGARLGEMTTSGYSLPGVPPTLEQTLIHVFPDPDELGRVYAPHLCVAARPAAIIDALAKRAVGQVVEGQRRNRLAACRQAYEAWQIPEPTIGSLRMEAVIAHLNSVLPDDAIVTNGAGNYAAWLHRYYRYRGWRTQLAPTSGSMGYGLPAAVAASLEHPDKPVVCLAGDGCLQMTVQELGTAMQYGAKPKVLVANNGFYGTIRMHQHRTYPGRPSGTALANPDFARLAQSYGGYGASVDSLDAFRTALDEALAFDGLAVIDMKLDPRALSPRLIAGD